MIQLDGNYGEGGGALVRTALALSVLTGKSFEVKNIRAGRPEPGLKAQHLTAINALKEMSGAKTNDIFIGSTQFTFIPEKIKKGIYEFDIGTAGSISLFLQAVLLPCLFASGKISLRIKGGTCGKWQASVHYLQNILLPQLSKFAKKIELNILKPGYYPKGGGEVNVLINPKFNLQNNDHSLLYQELMLKTKKIRLTQQGTLEQIRGIINLSAELQEQEVAQRIKISAESILKRYNVPINWRIEYTRALSIGGEIILLALFSNNKIVDPDNPVILGSDALIEKGKRSEEIGKDAAEKLIQEISSTAAVDNHLTDQLIPFMALLPGSKISSSEISNHTRTNIYVTEQFLEVKFKMNNNHLEVEKI